MNGIIDHHGFFFFNFRSLNEVEEAEVEVGAKVEVEAKAEVYFTTLFWVVYKIDPISETKVALVAADGKSPFEVIELLYVCCSVSNNHYQKVVFCLNNL